MRVRSKFAAASLMALMISCPAMAETPGFQRLNQETIAVLTRKDGQDETWIREEYRSSGGMKLRAEIIRGKSASSWEIPKREDEGTDSPLGFGCTYKTVSLEDGTVLAVETHPMWGTSVTGKVSDQVITVEAPLEGLETALNLMKEMLRERGALNP